MFWPSIRKNGPAPEHLGFHRRIVDAYVLEKTMEEVEFSNLDFDEIKLWDFHLEFGPKTSKRHELRL